MSKKKQRQGFLASVRQLSLTTKVAIIACVLLVLAVGGTAVAVWLSGNSTKKDSAIEKPAPGKLGTLSEVQYEGDVNNEAKKAANGGNIDQANKLYQSAID